MPIAGVVILLVVMGLLLYQLYQTEFRENLLSFLDTFADVDWQILLDERVTQYLPHNPTAAIDIYSQLTGAEFFEAKRAIHLALSQPEILERKKARSAEQSLSDAGVRELVEDGRINEAVELYRQFTGVDEYTARDYVDNIDDQLRDQRGS